MKKLKSTQEEWVDPDDAPELDEQWFKKMHMSMLATL